jgi:hypothetical protein
VVLRFSTSWARMLAESLGAEWALPLPRALGSAPARYPQGLVEGDRIVVWGPGTAVRVDAETGAIVDRVALQRAVPVGFDASGAPLFRRDDGLHRLDPATAALEAAPEAALIVERAATDAPELPEDDPTLVIGSRRVKARLETRSRVTRHHLEVCDEGHPPREIEIAAYTLRSDRLTLRGRGGGRIVGAVGMDPECPVASIAGTETGPLVVARRRHPAWHEHVVAGGTPDLVGHGAPSLELIVVPEGHASPRAKTLGTIDEAWEGLERRSGAPPAIERATSLRPLGVAGERLLAECSELAAPSRDGALRPRRRALAAFSLTGIC